MGLGENYKQLLESIERADQLRFSSPYAGPHMLRSNYPVLMPSEYSRHIDLKLDSNIIFYVEDEETNTVELVDMFAVKGGPLITMSLGIWSHWDSDLQSSGFSLFESMNR